MCVMSEREAEHLGLYVPRDLVKALDKVRGPFSRSRFIVLILQDAVKKGVDAAKVASGF